MFMRIKCQEMPCIPSLIFQAVFSVPHKGERCLSNHVSHCLWTNVSVFLSLQYKRHKNRQHTRNFAKSVVNLVDGVSTFFSYCVTNILHKIWSFDHSQDYVLSTFSPLLSMWYIQSHPCCCFSSLSPCLSFFFCFHSCHTSMTDLQRPATHSCGACCFGDLDGQGSDPHRCDAAGNAERFFQVSPAEHQAARWFCPAPLVRFYRHWTEWVSFFLL